MNKVRFGALTISILMTVAACGDDAQTAGTAIEVSTTSQGSTTTGADSTTSTAAPTTTTTVVFPVSEELVLLADGLSVAPFGTSRAATVAAVTAALGFGPTGEAESGGDLKFVTHYDACPGPAAEVSWGDLRLLFTAVETPWSSDGSEHFFGWQYFAPNLGQPAGLTTNVGIGHPSSEDEVVAAYGDRVEIVNYADLGLVWAVDDDPEDEALLTGQFDPSPLADEFPIQFLRGGVGCGW